MEKATKEEDLRKTFQSELAALNLPTQEDIATHIINLDSTTYVTIKTTVQFLKDTSLQLKKEISKYIEENDLRSSPQELLETYLDFFDYTGALVALAESAYRRVKSLKYKEFLAQRSKGSGKPTPVAQAMVVIDGECSALKGISTLLDQQSRSLWERIQVQKRLLGNS